MRFGINCDCGESYGRLTVGQDEAVIPYVTSANIACGFHGGDPTTIRRTARLAARHGVACGAHPSLPDLMGFGRREMTIAPTEFSDLIVYQLGAVKAVIEAEGARCVLGGGPHDGLGGQFVQPTIFAGVNGAMRIAQEEVFGPVLAVIPFEDEAEAVEIANDVKFGLAAGVWTRDIGRALRMSERLHAGTVWVNTYRAVSFTSPFGSSPP